MKVRPIQAAVVRMRCAVSPMRSMRRPSTSRTVSGTSTSPISTCGSHLPARIGQAMLLGQVPVDLLHEEGDAFGLGIDQLHQRVREAPDRTGHAACPPTSMALSRLSVMRETVCSRDRCSMPRMNGCPGWRSTSRYVPITSSARPPDASRHALEQLRRRFVGPVQVFQHDQHRLDRGGAVEEVAHALEHVVTSLVGRQRQGRRQVRVGDTHFGNEAGDLGARVAHRRPESVLGRDGQSVLDGLHEGDVGQRALHVVDTAPGPRTCRMPSPRPRSRRPAASFQGPPRRR